MYINPMLTDKRYPTCLAPWNALTIKRRDFFWGRRLLLHLNVVASGQHPKRFGIIDLLQLHEKGDQASALAAGKALENALGGQEVKRRRLLVRERT